ncbi:PDZ domain-containing protein [Actinobacteria bacterium IMCC26103]|nr:PDZ domain-containing protein [Actinobacteria bacterium IMCC26103]
MQLLGILAFIFALLFSVMVHEFGHYLTARKFGMRVSEFFLGFGTRIWSHQRGETEFGIKAIPAGGYCRIEGMTPDDEMAVGEEGRAFYRASSGKKLIVLGAGSFLHFALGYLLLLLLVAGVGVNQVLPAIDTVAPNSAAAAAGFQKGDEIVAINGDRNTNWQSQLNKIRNSKGANLTFTIKRGGAELEISAAPRMTNIDDGSSRYVLGIINKFGTKRLSPVKSVTSSAQLTWHLTTTSAKSLVQLPTKIPALWGQTFGGEKRDQNGLVGVVGVARVSGQAASSGALTVSERLGTFILIVASLNIFVGLFNLLPILPLDGGHMAVAIADEIRALFARLRGKARPAAIDVKVLTPITAVVFVVLAALTVLLLIADIFNPISLNL